MDLELSSATLLALLLGSVRAAAWLIVCPPFQSRVIPGPLKALLAVALALPMVPKLTPEVPAAQVAPILVSAAEQAVVGVALGFITALFFAAVQAAGDLIDLFGGFALAFGFDPLAQTSTSVFGRFYNLIAVTLLFATEGHQMVLRGFLESYDTLPLTGTLSLSQLSELLTTGLDDMFVSALQMAGPLIAVLFLTDVALGLLNRVAPALNAFSLGFPAKIFLTLSIAGTAIAVLPRTLAGIVETAVKAVVSISGGG
ncbi:flagellar biosynthetic protein FliR [Pilimelia terevasa]|uniref:Flagellar biosynthetic protein FliR n=1 Tax=Pilimelia terevasa TaxID=53372 RepID=A0A8J3BGK4_9ACTN|nr:flagellar biosynthetic protein FliR [Pilimelia terevasa]GGK18029.1 flagellar biosynthetic protein FliR [Pilimelia terevasa]